MRLSGWEMRLFPHVFGNLFRDGAVRYAVKFGLAGVLAVYIALWLRLPEPTWALFTIFVLMIAQYVGAIAEKSFLRFVGTVVGGLIGYLLTASFEQEPTIFLLLVGLVVGISTAMFGQARYPYAFLLCGMTTVVVTGNGMADPDNSWKFMLARVEEVSLGIIVTLVVQSIVWPRYAHAEFLRNLRSSFGDLKECFVSTAGIARNQEDLSGVARAEDFPARISALHSLLTYGARESQYFRNRLATYCELTGCLGRIASAISTLHEPLGINSIYQEWVGKEMKSLHEAIENALGDLQDTTSDKSSRTQCRNAIHQIFETIEEKLTQARSDPRSRTIPPAEAMAFSVHLLALDQIQLQISRAHTLIDSLPTDFATRVHNHGPLISPWPPPFWIHNGIKSALAVTCALVIDNWLNPPGGPMFVLGTWVFTALNPASPGGQGDRRTFHFVPLSIATLIALSLILIAARPMLSSYAVMNTIIFTWLFVWGYLSYNTQGVTIPMQVGMLCMVGILGLNGQEPVSFQAIVQFFFGISLALVLAAVIQRVIWPSLPQWELRDRFVELIEIARRLVREGSSRLPIWQKTRLELIPNEASARIELLHPPICPSDEPKRLHGVLRTLSRINGHLAVASGQLTPLIPPEHAQRATEILSRLETAYEARLLRLKDAFQKINVLFTDDADLRKILADWDQWVGELRLWMISHEKTPHALSRVLGFAEQYKLAGEGLLDVEKQTAALRLPLYMGDYVL